jgi:hypothetical protein
VRVHSLTLSFTPGLPLLARNLASLCLGREPKVRVATHKNKFNYCLSKVLKLSIKGVDVKRHIKKVLCLFAIRAW